MPSYLRAWCAAVVIALLAACGGGGGGSDGSESTEAGSGFDGVSVAANDLSGTPRARPVPTMGALEAN